MSVTVQLDEETLIEMLVDRVGYWTGDEGTLALFKEYYTNAVYGGCFEGADFDICSIVDNDYVNNTSITTREEFEKDREEYIKERMKANGFMDEEVTEEEKEEALKEYEENTPTWEDLECGENNIKFLSGYSIEAISNDYGLILMGE